MVLALLKGVLLSVGNRRGLLMVELGLHESELISLRFPAKALEITVDKRNARTLYYLIELRNHGVKYDGSALVVPDSDIRLDPRALNIDELAVILFSFRYGLPLRSFDQRHFLTNPPNSSAKFVVRKDVYGDLSTVFETFVRNQYAELEIANKKVLDIGAAIGDSAVFFALKGASIVMSYEPNEELFALCQANIAANGLNNVLVTKAAVGSYGMLGKEGEEPESPTIGFDETVRKMGSVDVLKMDCEGCEFGSLLGATPDTLAAIGEMVLEYHGNPDIIARRLREQGFKVTVQTPWTYFSGKTVGFMRATRRST